MLAMRDAAISMGISLEWNEWEDFRQAPVNPRCWNDEAQATITTLRCTRKPGNPGLPAAARTRERMPRARFRLRRRSPPAFDPGHRKPVRRLPDWPPATREPRMGRTIHIDVNPVHAVEID